MSLKWIPSSRAPARRGATLIEVLAGLVLLGTILASALVARGRFQRQWRDADDKLAAVRAVDELVGDWLRLPPGASPVPGEGTLPGPSSLTWRTSWRADAGAQRLGVRVARLEVLDARRRAREPVLSVEFLLPAPAPPAPTTNRSKP